MKRCPVVHLRNEGGPTTAAHKRCAKSMIRLNAVHGMLPAVRNVLHTNTRVWQSPIGNQEYGQGAAGIRPAEAAPPSPLRDKRCGGAAARDRRHFTPGAGGAERGPRHALDRHGEAG